MLVLVVLSCAMVVSAYPYYPYYGNMDTLSYGASDSSRGGVAMSRYYNPYYNPRTYGGGMAAFMIRQPEDQQQQQQQQPSQYYADRRRQTQPDANLIPQHDTNIPQQENEVYYPINPTDKTDFPTTDKTDLIPTTGRNVPEIIEPEIEEIEPKKRVSKKKQAKRPVEDEEEDDYPRMPAAAFFPMFFGYGGRGGQGGAPGGATAIANAYSTGRGGVASSHATAYGMPKPEYKDYRDFKAYQPQPQA